MTPQILVLCADHDSDACWVAQNLHATGRVRVTWVTPRQLSTAREWRHELGDGPARSEVVLKDGRRILGADFQGVLNRLTWVPFVGGAATKVDLDYAIQEWQAFVVSWLAALPGVLLNPPVPAGLGGALRSEVEWLALGSAAGLPVWPARLAAPATTVSLPPPQSQALVVGQHVLHAPERELEKGCQELAARARCPLLGVNFAIDRTRRWRMISATPAPCLQPKGTGAISALMKTLLSQ